MLTAFPSQTNGGSRRLPLSPRVPPPQRRPPSCHRESLLSLRHLLPPGPDFQGEMCTLSRALTTGRFFSHSEIRANVLTEKKALQGWSPSNPAPPPLSLASVLAHLRNPQGSHRGEVFQAPFLLVGSEGGRKGGGERAKPCSPECAAASVPCDLLPGTREPGRGAGPGAGPQPSHPSPWLPSQVLLPAWFSLPLCGLSSPAAIFGFILPHSSCFSGDGP